MLAQLSPWSDVEKATYLATSFKGLAKQFSTQKLYDYDIGIALVLVIHNTHQAEMQRMRLKIHTHRRDENLQGGTYRVIEASYPDASPSILELLTKDQFIYAVCEEEMRLSVMLCHALKNYNHILW